MLYGLRRELAIGELQAFSIVSVINGDAHCSSLSKGRQIYFQLIDGVGDSACVCFYITNCMQMSPLTIHSSVQRATTKSVSASKIQARLQKAHAQLYAPLRPVSRA